MPVVLPSPHAIDPISIKRLDSLNLQVMKISPEMKARMDDIEKQQFRIPVPNQSDTIYATVKVGGKIVATLYNSGASVTSNADYGKLRNLPSMGNAETATGPKLAQLRAEEIARALGGKVEKASTAQTAAEWHPADIKWTYDYKAMEAAKQSREQRLTNGLQAMEAYNTSAQAKITAQIMAQTDDADASIF